MIPDPKGYYAALDLQPNASPALIRAAYRVRAMELHPDRSDSLSSTHDFQRLQQAFDVLGDPARKAAYDAWALERMAAARPPAPPAAPARRERPAWAVPVGLLALVVVGATFWFLSDDPVRPAAPRRADAGTTGPSRPAADVQPLPGSGILRLDLPSEAFAARDRLPRLRLTAPAGTSFLVKLNAWDGNAPVMTIFVRAGDTTDVRVPAGRYRIRVAWGTDWFGDALRFGPATQYAQVDTLSEFQPVGDRVVQAELQLERYIGIDAISAQIPASSF